MATRSGSRKAPNAAAFQVADEGRGTMTGVRRMTALDPMFEPDRRDDGEVHLHFTPAEWRAVLEDPHFLDDEDNNYAPRRLLGVAVTIVPDHAFG